MKKREVSDVAHARAIASIQNRRQDVVLHQERTLNARKNTAAMIISRGSAGLKKLKEWSLRFLIPLLSADYEAIVAFV